eukprot:g22616.t1
MGEGKRFRKSSSGKNTTLGRTQVYKENSTSSTTLTFPDLNQFWNFTDQLSLKEERKICGGLMYHFKEQALPQEEWVESTASDVQWSSVIYSTYVTKHVLDEVNHALLPRLFPTIHLHSPAILPATPQTTTHVFLPTDASSSSNITNTYSADGMIKKVRGSDGDHTYMWFYGAPSHGVTHDFLYIGFTTFQEKVPCQRRSFVLEDLKCSKSYSPLSTCKASKLLQASSRHHALFGNKYGVKDILYDKGGFQLMAYATCLAEMNMLESFRLRPHVSGLRTEVPLPTLQLLCLDESFSNSEFIECYTYDMNKNAFRKMIDAWCKRQNLEHDSLLDELKQMCWREAQKDFPIQGLNPKPSCVTSGVKQNGLRDVRYANVRSKKQQHGTCLRVKVRGKNGKATISKHT